MGIIEHSSAKKNRVSLADYDSKQDIENRLLLSRFTATEAAVLEEILYSPIRSPLNKISKAVGISDEETLCILQKLIKTRLITLEGDTVVVDKEVRKYFEIEAEKFGDHFRPGMEFLQHLLKKVPIHVLPQWYATSRTSDNIFESIVEKYLLTPQIFQRYLLDLNFQDPTLAAIAQDVLKAPSFEVPAQEIQKKYNLTPEAFQEAILYLEFHFICTTIYRKEDDHWVEVVTLFQEWEEYLSFLKETLPTSIDPETVKKYRPSDFSFVDDMGALLRKEFLELEASYVERLRARIEELGLNRTETAALWFNLSSEDKALHLHRHQSNRSPIQEKLMRETEKSLSRSLNLGWILLSDFLKGACISLNEKQAVTLRKMGKSWKYQRPTYTPEELELIESVLLGDLFESGIIAIGTSDGKECICVTPFGQSLLG